MPLKWAARNPFGRLRNRDSKTRSEYGACGTLGYVVDRFVDVP